MLTVDLSKFATLLLILYPSKVCEYFLLFLTHCQCILFELKMFENFEEHSETEGRSELVILGQRRLARGK